MEVDTERMRANLDLTYGALFSQRVLLALVATGLSRDDAYRIVQRLAQQAISERVPLRELLAADPGRRGARPGRDLRLRAVHPLRRRDRRAAGRDRVDGFFGGGCRLRAPRRHEPETRLHVEDVAGGKRALALDRGPSVRLEGRQSRRDRIECPARELGCLGSEPANQPRWRCARRLLAGADQREPLGDAWPGTGPAGRRSRRRRPAPSGGTSSACRRRSSPRSCRGRRSPGARARCRTVWSFSSVSPAAAADPTKLPTTSSWVSGLANAVDAFSSRKSMSSSVGLRGVGERRAVVRVVGQPDHHEPVRARDREHEPAEMTRDRDVDARARVAEARCVDEDVRSAARAELDAVDEAVGPHAGGVDHVARLDLERLAGERVGARRRPSSVSRSTSA